MFRYDKKQTVFEIGGFHVVVSPVNIDRAR